MQKEVEIKGMQEVFSAGFMPFWRVCLGHKRGTYVQREGRMPGVRFVEFSGDCCAEADGFTLHANVRVHGRRRKQLERLIRYMARPAIATKRLDVLPDGKVHYRLRKPFHDGTRAILKCLDLPIDPPVLSPARWPP